MKYTKHEITEGHYFVETPDLVCQLEDGDDTELGLYVEVTDMDEATGEPEYKDYPFVVSISLMARNPDPSRAENGNDWLNLLYDTHSYMGGVPVDHTLTLAVNGGLKELAAQFDPTEAKLVRHKASFGTFAAQNGRGAVIEYLQFATADAADKFVDLILKSRIGCLPVMIGFVLDRPINLMGDNGWKTIRQQLSANAE